MEWVASILHTTSEHGVSRITTADAHISAASSRDVRISCSNAGYTMFRCSVKNTGYPLHSPVSPSFPLPCVTVCHHISNGLYLHQTLWYPLNPSSPTVSTFSAIRNLDVQTPGPSASLVDPDETLKKKKKKRTLRHPNQQLKEKHGCNTQG